MTWCIFKDGDRPEEGIQYLLYWYNGEDGYTLAGFKYNTKHEAVRTAEKLFGTNGDKAVRMFKKIKGHGVFASYHRERY